MLVCRRLECVCDHLSPGATAERHSLGTALLHWCGMSSSPAPPGQTHPPPPPAPAEEHCLRDNEKNKKQCKPLTQSQC